MYSVINAAQIMSLNMVKNKKLITKNINVKSAKRTFKIKTYKHGNCPMCGSRLDLRKSNPNSNQLRSSNRPHCRFTISFNKQLKQFYHQAIKEQKNFYKLPKFFKFTQEVILIRIKTLLRI